MSQSDDCNDTQHQSVNRQGRYEENRTLLRDKSDGLVSAFIQYTSTIVLCTTC